MTLASRALVLTWLAGTATIAAAPASAGNDPPVNVAAVASGDISGTLEVGRDVTVGQTVRTRAGKRVDLLFPDGSSLTLAPNAQAIVEAFSFDARRGVGHMVVRLASGLFRFSGGRIARQSAASFDTPAATLAIRGGIVLIRAEPTRTTAIAIAKAGVTVSTREGVQVLREPGLRVIAEAGSAPSPPAAAPASQLSAALAELDPGTRSAGSASSAAAGSAIGDASNAATNALSDANTLLQKSPAGGGQPGLRGRGQ
jgi:hypothetical protein